MRVIVFGSSGMVGRAVASRIRASDGIEMGIVDQRGNGLDVARDPDVRPLLEGATFAINCIGLLRNHPTYPSSAFRQLATKINACWPQTLAAQAAQVDCHVVHLSTDAVYSPGSQAAGESMPPNPCEPYGMSKALGEVDDRHVVNLRFSAIGSAPDRVASLWEWLARQPQGATVHGYSTFGWTGCTSSQLASLLVNLAQPSVFASVRLAGPVHHFVPNGIATKFEVLRILAARIRPDVTVLPRAEARPSTRPLRSLLGAVDSVYSGSRGWSGAVEDAVRGV